VSVQVCVSAFELAQTLALIAGNLSG